MTREEYLVDPSVQDFVDWLRPVVGGDVGFAHRYRALHSRCDWRCESLWNACGADGPPRPDRGYWWNRKGFGDNQRDLDGLSTAVRQASETGDGQLFLRAARGVLEWGGVRRNLARLDNLGMGALPTFVEAARLLDPSRADTGLLDGIGDLMNSGWTKVYALMLDGLPIYDSRVAASMGYLVREHCRRRRLPRVPKLLRFAWGAARLEQHNRNPSWETLRFSRLGYGRNGARRWAECSLWAAWVLGEVCSEGKFGKLPPSHRLRALEAALFMIGYELPDDHNDPMAEGGSGVRRPRVRR